MKKATEIRVKTETEETVFNFSHFLVVGLDPTTETNAHISALGKRSSLEGSTYTCALYSAVLEILRDIEKHEPQCTLLRILHEAGELPSDTIRNVGETE